MKKVILLIQIAKKKGTEESFDNRQSIVKWANMIYGDVLEMSLMQLSGNEYLGVAKTLPKAFDLIFAMEEYNLEEESGFEINYVINHGVVEDEQKLRNLDLSELSIKKCYEMLDRIVKSKRRFLTSTKSDTSINQMLKVTQHFIDSWKPKDRKTVTGFLQGRDYKEMARIEGKDESSLWRRRKSLAVDEYTMCKEVLQHLIQTK